MVALRDRSVNLLRRTRLGTLIGSRWASLALIVAVVILGQRLDLEDWASKAFPSPAAVEGAARASVFGDIWDIIKDLMDPPPDPDPDPQPAPVPPEEEGDGGW